MNIYIKNIMIIIASTLTVGILLGWLLFGEDQEPVKNQQTMRADNTVTIWTCSMHPQIRQTEPGDCPICGMDLIPVENNDNTVNPMAVSMSKTAMQLADIRTAVVQKMTPLKSVRLNGKVEADERLLFTQSSHIPGRIERLTVDFTGDYVKKGQVIAYIYSPELVTAQEELFEARKIKDVQPRLFSAAKEKLKNWKLSDEQIDDILKTDKPQDNFPVLADVSGYVTHKMINLGDYVQKGKGLYQIVDLSRVWVLFDVYESDLAWIKKGDMVNFTIASLPGESFSGAISYIDPVINPKTRVAKARMEVVNNDRKLKPEMFASGLVDARLSKGSKNLTVPKTAVMWTGTRSVVYVKHVSASGVNFILREVTLGPALGDSYIVNKGLQAGEEVAVQGTFSIDAAAQLAGKPSMMNPVGSIVLTSHNHGNQNTMAGDMNAGKEQNTIDKIILSDKVKTALQSLYSSYFELKNNLVQDNFEGAVQSAKNMSNVLNQIHMGIFTEDAHMIWMKYLPILQDGLGHINHMQSIGDLRNEFIDISNAMIALSESFGSANGEVYVQHCPMANNNKGADWLSKEKKIRNPYFGSAMLTCGEIKETIQ
ncbi:MAG: efflux RND transporter periplasmic adaptor subunit [Calditrichaceae bacterium]|nr:efflux RND transporter periplasmic adaptor subunit [Calditrichaceae bacterium]